MSFIAKHIANPDERIIYVARLHWIYFIQGLLWFAFFSAIGIGVDIFLWLHIGYKVPFENVTFFQFNLGNPAHWFLWMMLGTGFMMFLVHFFKYLASEIALTGRRIMYKTGLIFIEVEEIDLSEIRAEKVHHGLLGRFLGYGQLELDSRFVGDIWLPAIRKPYKFLQALHRTKSQRGDESPVPEEEGGKRTVRKL